MGCPTSLLLSTQSRRARSIHTHVKHCLARKPLGSRQAALAWPRGELILKRPRWQAAQFWRG